MFDSLSILKSNHGHLVNDKWVLRSDAQRLTEETLGQLGIVGQAVLQTDVQHWQMTPGKRRCGINEQGSKRTYQKVIAQNNNPKF